MSIAAQTASALARAAFIACAAVASGGWLSRSLGGRPGRARTVAWALLLAPFLTPSLLISYAYSHLALSLVSSPGKHQALYTTILLLKLLPVAALIRTLMPPPLSAEARRCHELIARPTFLGRNWFAFRSAGTGPWFAGALVFLLAFADFELASLWSVKTWTVALFDAQTGGLSLPESLRLAAWPLAIQLAVLAVLVPSARRSPSSVSSAGQPGRAAFSYLATSAFIITAIPLGVITTQAIAGFRTVAENFVLTDEIFVSVLFALTAAALAGGWTFRVASGKNVLPGIPGLLGALIVALLILALFQTPPLRPAYDTPLPLLLALLVILLPPALLLGAFLQSRHASPARHLARQTGSRRLAWELEMRPRLAAFGLLFCWAYFDFTASSILAPTRFTPVFVRLHNLAHYGQTAVLSAMMFAASAVPVALLLLTAVAGRIYARRDGR